LLLAMAWLAGAARADSIRPIAVGSAASLSDQSLQTPASAGAVPADLWRLLNPVPPALQHLVEPSFRADTSTPPTAPPALVPFSFLSATWQSQNLLSDIWDSGPP
jgi:hypothetical protein